MRHSKRLAPRCSLDGGQSCGAQVEEQAEGVEGEEGEARGEFAMVRYRSLLARIAEDQPWEAA